MSQLLAAQKIKETIVVGINNNGDYRWAEFVPQAILDSFPLEVLDYVMNIWLKGKPQSDAYLRFIVEELKPYIDRTYSTRPDLANTFIMGSSMGGIISLYAICKYPEVFGGAGCLSTHWLLGIPGINDPEWDYDIPAAFRTYLSDHLPSPFNHRIYFDFGSATLDSFYKPHQEKVDALMTMKGFTSADWITLEFPGEEHSERSWAKRLHIPLEFLLGKE
jgi:pimeloyl-ACP methyl ester carboxylesterase